DAQRARGDQGEQALAVRAESKKVIALLGVNQLERGMLDAMAVRDLSRLLELLAARAIQSLIVGDVQIAGTLRLNALQQCDDAAHVAWLRGPDPIVVAALEPAPVLGERQRHPVHPRARCATAARRSLPHGPAVLVHPHHTVPLIAPPPPLPPPPLR